MRKILVAVLLFTGLVSTNVFAGKHLNVHESIVIDAKAADVWAKISNFGDLGAWHPAIQETKIIEGQNNKRGAIRVLRLQGGDTIKEKLVTYSAIKQKYTYAILDGVLPVTNYRSAITVKPVSKDKSKVIWHGHFEATGASDEDAKRVVTGMYKAGLENLKKISETK